MHKTYSTLKGNVFRKFMGLGCSSFFVEGNGIKEELDYSLDDSDSGIFNSKDFYFEDYDYNIGCGEPSLLDGNSSLYVFYFCLENI